MVYLGTEVNRENNVTGRVLRNSSFFVQFPANTEQSGAAATVLDGILNKNVLVGWGFFFSIKLVLRMVSQVL